MNRHKDIREVVALRTSVEAQRIARMAWLRARRGIRGLLCWTLLTATAAMPIASLAQDSTDPRFHFDFGAAKQQIEACLKSNYQNHKDTCIMMAFVGCHKEIAPSDDMRLATTIYCMVGEQHIWQELLEKYYGTAIEELTRFDTNEKFPQPALPSFKAAHEAWTKWVEAACEYQLAAAKNSQSRDYSRPECLLRLTAKQVIHYTAGLPDLSE